jgi:hypothetical protein
MIVAAKGATAIKMPARRTPRGNKVVLRALRRWSDPRGGNDCPENDLHWFAANPLRDERRQLHTIRIPTMYQS